MGEHEKQVRISAIIACYRDAPAVPIMHERLTAVFRSLEVDYEIIFVNDGSPDNAREVLAELAKDDPHVVVINHTRPFGSQNAFTSGLRLATGDAAVLLDGDLQDPPELIAEFYKRWKEGYDVVYGERVEREAPRLMRFAYKAFYRVFRKFAYVQIPLDAGDFSLLDRRVVNVLNDLPETNRFVRGLRAWAGFRQIGVAYRRPERMFGTTTNSLLRNLGWARRGIISFSYAPLDAIMWLALATVAVSFVTATVQILLRIFDPSSVSRGITTVIVLVLFLGGIQLLCLSIIGSYLAQIFEEVKHRPSYVVESVLNQPDSSKTTAPDAAQEPSSASEDKAESATARGVSP
jgi:dolichol-phosphate mannosyltransferase